MQILKEGKDRSVQSIFSVQKNQNHSKEVVVEDKPIKYTLLNILPIIVMCTENRSIAVFAYTIFREMYQKINELI